MKHNYWTLIILFTLITVLPAQQSAYSCDEEGYATYLKDYNKTCSSVEWPQRLKYFTAAC